MDEWFWVNEERDGWMDHLVGMGMNKYIDGQIDGRVTWWLTGTEFSEKLRESVDGLLEGWIDERLQGCPNEWMVFPYNTNTEKRIHQ